VSAEGSLKESAERAGVLNVHAHFKISDEKTAQAVAAKLVDRAHEIANMQEWECDVEVDVEWIPPEDPPAAVGLSESARGHSTER
jgi:hypothetical protein